MLTFSSSFAVPALTGWIGALAARGATSAGVLPPDVSPASSPTAAAESAAPTPMPMSTMPPRVLSSPAHGATEPTAHYWPCERLNAFILQMAAHGHCVNAAMMLGHRPYAQQQLAQALQVADEALQALAGELQAYFSAPPESATLPGHEKAAGLRDPDPGNPGNSCALH